MGPFAISSEWSGRARHKPPAAEIGAVSSALLIVLAIGLLVSLGALALWQHNDVASARRILLKLDRVHLEDEKLREEVLSLTRNRGFVGDVPAYAGLLTAFVGVGGLLGAAFKQLAERKAEREQREAERADSERRLQRERETTERARHAELRQLEAESLRRFDESMKSMIANLGSVDPITQASAVASLFTTIESLLRPDFAQTFQDAIFQLVVATTRVDYGDNVRTMITRALEKVLRIRLATLQYKDRRGVLDFSHAHLVGADLAGLDLSEANFSAAVLSGANLRGARLTRVRAQHVDLQQAILTEAVLTEADLRDASCRGARFHEADLVSVRLNRADLTSAQFWNARLQSAHLEGAILDRARFEGADINDAFFRGASFRSRTLDSLLKCHHWEQAHFDSDVRSQLEAFRQRS